MDFNTYLNKAWSDHAKDSQGVARHIEQGLLLVKTSDELGQLARLSTHVFGEHLGLWTEGLLFLTKLKNHSLANESSNNSIKVFEASLNLSGNLTTDFSQLSSSEQVRVLSISASAVYEQGRSEKAKEYFLRALDLAQSGLDKKDLAHRALAIAGNNLACSLEEKPQRNSNETELMILAAQIGRKFWEIAGSWTEVERAEYRLAKTFLLANKLENSFIHAQNCIEICKSNSAPPLEFFFGFECLALVEKAKGDKVGYNNAVQNMKQYFEHLSEDDKSWCKSELEKFN